MHDSNATELLLGLPGFAYADLYCPHRLQDLLTAFDTFLHAADPELFQSYRAYRDSAGGDYPARQVSDLLVRTAPWLGAFLAKLFGVEPQRSAQMDAIRAEFDSIYAYKNEVVAKLGARYQHHDWRQWDSLALQQDVDALLQVLAPPEQITTDRQRAVAELTLKVVRLATYVTAAAEAPPQAVPDALAQITDLQGRLRTHPLAAARFAARLNDTPSALTVWLAETLQRWSWLAQHDPHLKTLTADWEAFKTPSRTDFSNLVQHDLLTLNGYHVWAGKPTQLRSRDGFHLTDPRFDERRTLYEVDHCIYCHTRDTDSCSKGMRQKEGFKVNPLGVTITGCPLDEKISEMHAVKRLGDNLGALALIMIDNPLCPGTGHRICNDCMKGCIYQKTEPVDIPQIETNVLTDVLFMPWGFEIYDLLTRWNPLNVRRPVALPYHGKNALVVGMGPAGYTLAHYLCNEGFGVVGIDGLKIEPLPAEWTGDRSTPPRPIRDFNALYEDLDRRMMTGFGGVAEYGITVRWDKNFLKVIYLSLARRRNFRVYGGVRFGGTLTINEAWDLGFDHIAIAAGAGKPTIIDLENNLARGIRKASDFLMALQLTGAAKESSLANLQVRLPAGVIGGGLTAIDTATETLAYYPRQVEKILHRYETLVAALGVAQVRTGYDAEELIILDEFLAHGRALRAERERAATTGAAPNFYPLLRQWGGVTVFYRKGIKDSPAYRQNHEEITHALAEGIYLAEGMSPLAALEDQYGHLRSVRFEQSATTPEGKWHKTGEVEVLLRSLFIAAGTSPNTIYEAEHPGTFVMDGNFYQRYLPTTNDHATELLAIAGTIVPKLSQPAPFTSYHKNGRFITFYGDNHPVYAGNVVKAMASAKHGYPYIVEQFAHHIATADPARQTERNQALHDLFARLDAALIARVVAVHRLTPNIVEVVVKAPFPAKHFCPGQFYRVQNYETHATRINGTVLATEGLALTGAWVDKERGLVSLIALEMGSSSRLCALWKTGDPLVVMGVTGTPTDIPAGRTVLLAGGGLGNAVLFSIGKALRAAGNQVLYFAGYRNSADVFKTEEIEAASDLVVWSVDDRPGNVPIPVRRPLDKSYVGNIVAAMVAYARGDLGDVPVHLDDVDHLIVIGSDRMMAAVKAARYDALAPYLKKRHTAIGSINSPMQCMMKGVCAQCLCKHIEPDTGRAYFVYSCYNQDQDLDHVDFDNLHARLRQNSVQEKLSTLWLAYGLSVSRADDDLRGGTR